jgi:hypothetical protein
MSREWYLERRPHAWSTFTDCSWLELDQLHRAGYEASVFDYSIDRGCDRTSTSDDRKGTYESNETRYRMGQAPPGDPAVFR